MSSAFWSELAKLDDNLQIIQSQVNWMRAGLEFDDGQLTESLTEARSHGAAVRDLVRAERADITWNDRDALERLIHELEIAAQERRNQLRRSKLRDLAAELDAGTIRHRLESRASALTKLRQEAAKQLRTEAELADQVKDLPGPRADQWVAWACNLQEEKDGFVLSRLRKDFGALDRFVAGIEVNYWVPGSVVHESAPHSEPDVRTAKAAAAPPPSAPRTSYAKPPQTVKSPEKVSTRTGSNGGAGGVSLGSPAGEAPSLTETLRRPEAGTQWQAATAAVGNGASKLPPPRLNYCEQCGSSYRGEFHLCPVDRSVNQVAAEAAAVGRDSSPSRERSSAAVGVAAAREPQRNTASENAEAAMLDSTAEAAGSEFERLKALIGDTYSVEDEEIEPSRYQQLLGNKRLMASAAAVAVVVVVAIFLMVHHFTSKSASQPTPAPQTVSAKVPDVIPDADIQKNIEQKLATLKGSSIQVAVQEGVVTLAGKVASKADVTKAESLAAEVSGVKQVSDKVQVETNNGKAGRRR